MDLCELREINSKTESEACGLRARVSSLERQLDSARVSPPDRDTLRTVRAELDAKKQESDRRAQELDAANRRCENAQEDIRKLKEQVTHPKAEHYRITDSDEEDHIARAVAEERTTWRREARSCSQ